MDTSGTIKQVYPLNRDEAIEDEEHESVLWHDFEEIYTLVRKLKLWVTGLEGFMSGSGKLLPKTFFY